MSERAARIVRDIGAVYAVHRINRLPKYPSSWALPAIIGVLTALLLAAVLEIRSLREQLDQAPVVVNCTQVVRMPDAERPGWYCIREGEEG